MSLALAPGRQQLYADGKHAEIGPLVEACLPKDEAGNFIAEQQRSDVVHDLLAYLAEKMLEMNPAEANGGQGLPGLAGELPGGQSGGPHAQDRSSQSYHDHDYESFLAVLRKNKKKLAIDLARREPAQALRAEFEGSMGKLLSLRERTLADG